MVVAGFASLAQGGLGKWGCEKLKLGSFKNNFVLPPFKKSPTEGSRVLVRRMVGCGCWGRTCRRAGWLIYYYYCSCYYYPSNIYPLRPLARCDG